MPHHHRIDYETIFESELVLAQFSYALTGIYTDIAGSRLQIAPQDFHEGRFPTPVGADQSVAIAIAELNRDILEQGFCPKLHGNIGCCNQRLFLSLPREGAGKNSPLYVSYSRNGI